MNTHFDPKIIESIKGKYIILDNNVLSDSASDPEFYETLYKILENNHLFIDPIVKLEFLRGAYLEKTYKEKNNFLKIEIFTPMIDHNDIYKKVYDSAFDIARIYSHHKRPNVPLGDIFITARQQIQTHQEYFFLTEDIEDFTTLLFDRVAILSFERKHKDGNEHLQHLQLLKFNHKKFQDCLASLPQ